MIARNLDDRFVDVTLNEFCQKSNENYTVLVSFGVFDIVGVCQVEYKESMDIEPGISVRVELDTGRISEEREYRYCANVIVNSTAGLTASTWKS